MFKLALTIFLMTASGNAFGQGDAIIPTGIGINAGELINIVRTEPNVRVSFEQGFSNRYSILVEPGIYVTGTGYNIRAGIKRHGVHLSKKHKGPNYMGVTVGTKSHFYGQNIGYHKDSTWNGSLRSKVLNIGREAYRFDVVLGWVKTHGHFYFDWYVGAGIRYKKISGITEADIHWMEDDAGSIDLIPGSHVVPDITAGLRLGLQFNKRSYAAGR